MSLMALEGVYRDGVIELAERPAGIRRARVVVTFLPTEKTESEAEEREAARQRAFQRMAEGLDLGGVPFDRQRIYEERLNELQQRRERSA